MQVTPSSTAGVRLVSSPEPGSERHEGAITEPLEDQIPASQTIPQAGDMRERMAPALEPGDEQPVPEHEQAERQEGVEQGPVEDQPPSG